MSSYHVISILIFTMVFLITDFGNAQRSSLYSYQISKSRMDKAQYFCGKNIPDTLQKICQGKYNVMFKKNGQEREISDYPYGFVGSFPFIPRTRANGMLNRRSESMYRRESRGIHEECCLKPCTISELSTYCSQDD